MTQCVFVFLSTFTTYPSLCLPLLTIEFKMVTFVSSGNTFYLKKKKLTKKVCYCLDCCLSLPAKR